jgi:Arc/MetJ family transcription regulator
MRTTLNLDDKLIADAIRATGITQKTKLIDIALRQMVQRQASLALANMGGTMPDLVAPSRRRWQPGDSANG